MQTNLLALLKLLFQNNKVIHFAQKPIQNIIIKLPTSNFERRVGDLFPTDKCAFWNFIFILFFALP
jgi:hypothetical protein